MKLNVWKITPSGSSYSLSSVATVDTWRECNKIRSSISRNAKVAKDNSFPVVYDHRGNFIVEGWQK